jgi:hypothetical protein
MGLRKHFERWLDAATFQWRSREWEGPEPVTHDYTRRGWGHDYTFDPIDGGKRGQMTGWGRGIEDGDFLILKNGEGETRYRVENIGYSLDPPDMWFAAVTFAPRD